LGRIRFAREYLEEHWDQTFSENVFVYSGNELYRLGPWGEVESVWQHPGQLAFQAVAMAVSAWKEEAIANAVEIAI
jgi:hypothetical protein